MITARHSPKLQLHGILEAGFAEDGVIQNHEGADYDYFVPRRLPVTEGGLKSVFSFGDGRPLVRTSAFFCSLTAGSRQSLIRFFH